MPQELRFATFNVCNLALPGKEFYANQAAYTQTEYEAKTDWIAQQLDLMDADVIGFQEIFSQEALKNVLSKTVKYQNAHHIGFDPISIHRPLTPNVAIVSRLPIAANTIAYDYLPNNLAIALPYSNEIIRQFTRPVLHAKLNISEKLLIDVFVVHFKSKRPELTANEHYDNSSHLALATLRSLVRRGTEALGLRYLLNEHRKKHPAPLIIMGDFNDVAESVTTQIVMGIHESRNADYRDRFFECSQIQVQPSSLKDVGFSHVQNGILDSVDHILVSEEFHPASEAVIGEVKEVIYLNDHLALNLHYASDHGQVVMTIGIK